MLLLLSNYRKIRAISTGVAAEYSLNAERAGPDNTMLGSNIIGREKYAKMGADL
jgi:hypothetical protein